jgi:hypothetical protein
MKFYSHRPQDRFHLSQMNVTAGDREFVMRFLNSLAGTADQGVLEMAKHFVENWA